MDQAQAARLVQDLLKALLAKKGSDLFLNAGYPPAIKIDGKVTPVSDKQLEPEHTVQLAVR